MSFSRLMLNELIRSGLAGSKHVQASLDPKDREALALAVAQDAQIESAGHFRQRWRLPKAGRCQCGCGEKIAANKQFKFGHDKKEISADSLIPESEVPNAGAE